MQIDVGWNGVMGLKGGRRARVHMSKIDARELSTTHPNIYTRRPLPTADATTLKMTESAARGGSFPWASPEQLEYMKSMKTAYNAAKASSSGRGKKIADFWVVVFEHFVATWPFPPLTEEEKVQGKTEKARLEKMKAVSTLSEISPFLCSHGK